MGLVLQNMNKYTRKWKEKSGKFSGKEIMDWFGGITAPMRTSLDDMSFNKRSAVVIVGASGSGKTYFANKLINHFPNFVLCSHDECYAKAMSDLNKLEGPEVEDRMIVNLEKMLRNAAKNNKNVILDGLFVDIIVRVAIIETLRTLGFEIHIVYITTDTFEKTISEYAIKRSVQKYLHNMYSEKHKAELTAQELLSKVKCVVQIFAEENGLTEEEVYLSFCNNPEVVDTARWIAGASIQELEKHNVYWQERVEAFMWGADYYYEI